MTRLSNAQEKRDLGKRLHAVRTACSLTQTEMANRLGVTLRAYANYERGEREVAVAVLLALYKRFAIDPVWVMLGHPNSRPKRVAERRINGAQIEDAEY